MASETAKHFKNVLQNDEENEHVGKAWNILGILLNYSENGAVSQS